MAAARSGRKGRRIGRRIGLLGGSFNPAHQGHLAISQEAIKRLGLDEVWWLVSPQNPLKAADAMAAFASRLRGARELARTEPGRRITASDFEARMATRFTADTLAELGRRHPGIHFVWLMGADNLAQLHRWYRWHDIMAGLPIAVFDRPGWTYRALASRAARRYKARRCLLGRQLARQAAPAWCFLFNRRLAISATEIRQKQGE